jgi:membrane protease YdiL (CAAX protease family)
MIEFVEQVVYIGLAEEFFFRGYVAGRLINWLGSGKGILGSAAIFALAHFVSRVSQGGFRYPMRLAEVCLQTLIGGLLLGYIYWRSKNIYPGAILHIAGNLYIGRVIDLLNAL